MGGDVVANYHKLTDNWLNKFVKYAHQYEEAESCIDCKNSIMMYKTQTLPVELRKNCDITYMFLLPP